MHIAEVIGNVVLSNHHPSLGGATWLVCVPLSATGLRGALAGRGEPVVVYDERGAGLGALVAVTDGAEATAPFHPAVKPIDAYNAAILDTIDIGPSNQKADS